MNVYESILQGLNEAVAYTKGTCKEARVHKISVEPVPHFNASDIRSIRMDLGMTQVIFASVMGVSPQNCGSMGTGHQHPKWTLLPFAWSLPGRSFQRKAAGSGILDL